MCKNIYRKFCLGEQDRPLVHPKERAKAEARSQIKIEKEQTAKLESHNEQELQTGNNKPEAQEEGDENIGTLVKRKDPKPNTPVKIKQVKEKSGPYKNIFEVTCVEGKRQRKPKIMLDVDEESLKSAEAKSPKVMSSNNLDSLQTADIDVNKSATLLSPVIEKPTEWHIGDQLWAKVAGHPWWPCMIAKDPYEDLFTKMKGETNSVFMLYLGHRHACMYAHTNLIDLKEGNSLPL